MVLVLVAVTVSIAVVVAHGGGEDNGGAASRPVAVPAARLAGPSSGQWKSGVRPLLAAKPTSPGTADKCPKESKSRPRPADFPATFPLPRGMVVTQVRHSAPSGAPVVYMIGHAPLSLDRAARFFVRELPLHAYYITSSEAEPIEIEARFDGPAKGALKVIGLPSCSNAVWMLIGVSGT